MNVSARVAADQRQQCLQAPPAATPAPPMSSESRQSRKSKESMLSKPRSAAGPSGAPAAPLDPAPQRCGVGRKEAPHPRRQRPAALHGAHGARALPPPRHPHCHPAAPLTTHRLHLVPLLLALLIAACAWLPFATTLSYDFIDLDDYDYVVTQPQIAAGLSWQGLGWALRTLEQGIWMPLTWLSYMADVSLAGGVSPRAMHTTNLLLHSLNSLLLFFLLRQLLAREREGGAKRPERLPCHRARASEVERIEAIEQVEGIDSLDSIDSIDSLEAAQAAGPSGAPAAPPDPAIQRGGAGRRGGAPTPGGKGLPPSNGALGERALPPHPASATHSSQPTTHHLQLLLLAAGATLFWALHPLRVEPVVWIASRKDLLALTWELLALLAWAAWARRRGSTSRPAGAATVPESHPCHRARASDVERVEAIEEVEGIDSLDSIDSLEAAQAAGLSDSAATPPGQWEGQQRLQGPPATAPAPPMSRESRQSRESKESILSTQSIPSIPSKLRSAKAPAAPRPQPTAHRSPLTAHHSLPLLLPLALLCFLLALMAKPTAITFPLLAALLELWQRRTITPRCYLLPLLLAGAVAALAAYAQAVGGATSALAAVPLTARLLNALAAIGAYGWQTLWPRHLALQCQHRWPLLPHYWQQGLILTALLGLSLTLLGRRLTRQWQPCAGGWQTRAPQWQVRLTAALLFPLLAVAPMLGIAHFGIHARADRFTYLPAIGASLLLLLAGVWLTRRLSRRGNLLLAAAAVAALLLLAQQTQQQAHLWRDEATIFSHTLAVDGPGNIQAHLALAKYHYEVSHNLPLARQYLSEALQRDPTTAGQYGFLLAIMLLEEGETESLAAVAAQQLAWVEEFKRQLAASDAKATQLRYAIPSLLAFAAQHIGEGDYELAQEKLDYLARLRPDSPWVPYLRYLQAQRQGDHAAAVKAHQAVLRAHGEPYLRHRFLE